MQPKRKTTKRSAPETTGMEVETKTADQATAASVPSAPKTKSNYEGWDFAFLGNEQFKTTLENFRGTNMYMDMLESFPWVAYYCNPGRLMKGETGFEQMPTTMVNATFIMEVYGCAIAVMELFCEQFAKENPEHAEWILSMHKASHAGLTAGLNEAVDLYIDLIQLLDLEMGSKKDPEKKRVMIAETTLQRWMNEVEVFYQKVQGAITIMYQRIHNKNPNDLANTELYTSALLAEHGPFSTIWDMMENTPVNAMTTNLRVLPMSKCTKEQLEISLKMTQKSRAMIEEHRRKKQEYATKRQEDRMTMAAGIPSEEMQVKGDEL